MKLRTLVPVVAVMALGMPAWGHHSHTNYEMTEYLDIEGTVTTIHWINPHIWIYIEVAGDEGETEFWVLESATPRQLARNGVDRDTVNAGDSISARCHRLRDGSRGCLLGYLTGRDGVERLWD